MNFSISHLRRWFAIAVVIVCLAVAGVYFRARRNVQNALREVPQKLNIEVQQSAQAFTISKSEEGRTLFKLQANKAVQFKQGGHVELHDVTITVYGRDSSRFDQIYGKEFEYDQSSGNVTSNGEVSIDLQSNPQGMDNPDQSMPKELKNPIHLKTTKLVFDQKTGDAWTSAVVEFYVPQASGSALGAKYDAKDNVLTLESRVRVALSGGRPTALLAQRAMLTKNPREIKLQQPEAESPERSGRADEATLYLRDDNTLEHAVASGHVILASIHSEATTGSVTIRSRVTAQKLEMAMLPRNEIESTTLSGDVHLTNEGKQLSEAWAGRAEVSFGLHNAVTKIHSVEQVRLVQRQGSDGNGSQDVQVSAPAIDFAVARSNRLSHAETFGAPEIELLPIEGKTGPATRVTADKFTAKFDPFGQLSQVHGEANARVVTTASTGKAATQPDRISTSNSVDAYFRPGTGIETLVQHGDFVYSSGTQQAFADQARYTPSNQILILSGAPRMIDSGMETTANSVRLNRATGEGFAQGDVRTTYNDLKTQSNGALLASSDPIHVSAESMTARSSPASATYKGDARLWQGANVINAPFIQFQKEQRVVIADSNPEHKVSTAVFSSDKTGKTTPVDISADHLVYRDTDRKARYSGGVVAKSTDLTMSCSQMDVFFVGAKPPQPTRPSPGVAPKPSEELEKIVAAGSVVVTEPKRRATGDKLIYVAEDEKFVLTGGPPSIFDAERGKITGVSLTLYSHDDRVIVDGNSSSPAVTEIRVER